MRRCYMCEHFIEMPSHGAGECQHAREALVFAGYPVGGNVAVLAASEADHCPDFEWGDGAPSYVQDEAWKDAMAEVKQEERRF